MNKYIKERVYKEAKCILKDENTIREIAKKFNISKSTVHKDLKEKLCYLDKKLANKVNKILKKHILTRHLRGGEATKRKYKQIKEG